MKTISGFGINVNWDWDKTELPNGHTMPFMQALSTTIDGLPIRVAFPKWLLSLTESGREAARGAHELEVGDTLAHSTNDLTAT